MRKLEYEVRFAPASMDLTEADYGAWSAAKGGLLLPHLHSIIWTTLPRPQCGYDTYHLLKDLYTPTLRSVTIVCQQKSDRSSLAEALEALPQACPYMQECILEVPSGGFDIATLSVTLHNCTALDRLTLVTGTKYVQLDQAEDPTFVSRLAALPMLRDLQLMTGCDYTSQGDLPPISDIVTLPTVERLSIRSRDTISPNAILRAHSVPNLQRLVISYTRRPDPENLAELSSLAARSQSLKRFELTANDHPQDFAGGGSQHPNRLVIEADHVLRPLLSCRHLRVVTLRLSLPIALSDADLHGFARAWPALRSLEIVGGRQLEVGVISTRPTYLGIAHLVRHCPDIAHLSLVISDAEAPPTSSIALENLPVSTNRMALMAPAFNHSKVNDLTFTAGWIRTMFPQAVTVYRTANTATVSWAGNSQDVVEWTEVVRLIESN